jgi:hypothetical protein
MVVFLIDYVTGDHGLVVGMTQNRKKPLSNTE